MLIRINLLPVRQAQQRELGKQFLVLAIIVVAATAGGNWSWWNTREAENTKLVKAAADTQKRITELEKVIGEVNNLNKRKKEVEDKLKVLNELRKGRAGPVRMLDALATAIPTKVYLSTFNEANNNVKLGGRALSHEDVAEFMKSLSTIVWTPKGIGKVVERKRDATTVRVELHSQGGAIEDFSVAEVSNFFTSIDLARAVQGEDRVGSSTFKRVDFDISMVCNYAI